MGGEIRVVGPPVPFDTLVETDREEGLELHPDFVRAYGGPWTLPPAGQGPHVYVNFVVSHDGRVTFNHPDHVGGGPVADHDQNDVWLMGLLRARADVVLMGDATLIYEPDHVWTAEFIYPPEAEAFSALRRSEGRWETPILVLLSLTGEIPADVEVLSHPEIEMVIATTHEGAKRARKTRHAGPLTVLDLGEDSADLGELVRILRESHGAHTILCEGGPRVYGAMLAAGQVDDVFTTRSPVVVGEDASGPRRSSLVEGAGFLPVDAPRILPRTIKMAGDHLYLRGSAHYPAGR